MGDAVDDGQYEIYSPPLDRQLAMEAFAALPATHPMVALLEFDVTRAEAAIEAMQRGGLRVSLFAFLVRSIAVAIAEHPDLNLVRHGRRLVRFDDVDVSVPVEVRTPNGKFPREIVLRRAQHRTPAELYAEIEAARERHDERGETSDEDRWARRMFRVLRFVPSFARIGFMRMIMRNAFTIKRRSGTTLVTSVGKFASIPGYAFTLTTGPRAAAFAIGGVFPRPAAVDGRIEQRRVVPIALMINHDLVDGAPAARFARRLQALVESADELDPPQSHLAAQS
jgi:pyruvate/2-oxoglutarate dehydrogenase complex dihydrolipoamide acyltransferase (E2) component